MLDDDTAGITVSALQATEVNDSWGATSFTITLGSQPAADVTVYVVATPSGQVKVSPVTFTPSDYYQRTVPIEAVIDGTVDGDHQVTLKLTTSSADSKYSNVPLQPLSLMVKDGDKAGISAYFSTFSRTTFESSSTTCVDGSVSVFSKPKANVRVRAVISNPNEATASNTLTFTPSGSLSHPIRICGLDDPYADGDQLYTVKFVVYETTDANYIGLELRERGTAEHQDVIESTPKRLVEQPLVVGRGDYEPIAWVRIEDLKKAAHDSPTSWSSSRRFAIVSNSSKNNRDGAFAA